MAFKFNKSVLWFLILGLSLFIIPVSGFCIDLTLDQAIGLAIENNSSYKINQVKTKRAGLEILKKKMEYIPKLSLTSSYIEQDEREETQKFGIEYQNSQASILQKVPLGGKISLFYNFENKPFSSHTRSYDKYNSEFSVFYQQALLKDGIIGPAFVSIKQANFDCLIQENEFKKGTVALVNKVITAFYNIVINQKILKIYRKNVKQSAQLLELARSRYENGLIPEFDVMVAEIEGDKANHYLISSDITLKKAVNEMQNLLNMSEPIRALYGQLEKGINTVKQKDGIPQVLKNNIDLKILKQKIESAKLKVRVAENHLLPQLDLFTKFKKLERRGIFSRLNNFESDEFQVGLILSYPIYNKKEKINFLQSKSDLDMLKHELKDLEHKLINFSNMLVEQLELLDKKRQAVTKQLDKQKKLLDLSMKAFKEGLISIDRTYATRDDLLKIENEYFYVLFEQIQKWVSLQVIMGNGDHITAIW